MTDYSKTSTAVIEVPEGIKIDTIPAQGHRPVIEWVYAEFQSLCPVSERHDQGAVNIRYRPKDTILESKSVRNYLMLWRNKRNWQEYITEEIADILYHASEPEWLTVSINWSVRGGIAATTVSKRGEMK